MFQGLKNKAVAILSALGVGLAIVSTSASAALPTGVDTAMATVQSDATSLAGIVAPVMIAILGLVITLKLIKRFANKI